MIKIDKIKIAGILIIIIGSTGIIFSLFRNAFMFIDFIPWIIGFLIYPLTVSLLIIYENLFSPDWFNYFAYSIIYLYYSSLLILGVGLLHHKGWAYCLAKFFILFNLFIGIILALLAKFIIMIPLYILLYGFALSFFFRCRTMKNDK